MSQSSEIFERHYRSYCEQIQELNFGAIHRNGTHRYQETIPEAYPSPEIIHGTHQAIDKAGFQRTVKELLCQTLSAPQTMNNAIKGDIRLP